MASVARVGGTEQVDVGRVYLVGAGPGDPGLLTVRAKQLLAQADVIVYDRLLSPRLLTYARCDAELVYVGKVSSNHTMPQSEIESVLIDHALQKRTVVRLKGGDPFVFGRGGEEAAALAAAGIPFEVVPGVTSAISAPAYAGIPLTHRKVSPGFSVVTGHACLAPGDAAVPWERFRQGTLVILMGVAGLGEIVHRLIQTGRPVTTPVAAVQWGTRASQRVITSSLASIVTDMADAGVSSPAVIVVGDVVGLRDELSWREARPLYGKRIVTVADDNRSAQAIADIVEDFGGEAWPLSVERQHVVLPQALRAGLDGCLRGHYKGIAFQHGFTVAAWFEALRSRRIDIRTTLSWRFVARTLQAQAALAAHGLVVEHTPYYSVDDVFCDDQFVELQTARETNPLLREWLVDGVDAMWAPTPDMYAYGAATCTAWGMETAPWLCMEPSSERRDDRVEGHSVCGAWHAV